MTPHKHSRSKSYSWTWVFLSMGIFLGIELFLGGFVAQLLAGRFVGRVFLLRIELLLMLASYLLGGILVGVLSPGIRILEPGIGAFLAVFLTFLYSVFTPMRLFGFSSTRLLIAGVVAFALALFGADLGERLAARFGNRSSQKYVQRR
ncbi:hypothetical protein GF339_20915 [candidate division KSB3 bacterium]|uniref:Uncharacterized protein n=1 Tax=candidate division KSB3 bacterium TaxID=2044937 RepID=A0A9D5Q8N9_9BACT|nr:hypothetical protein [candidate division KSB3 bacterium]MBD3327061.1 hypothetical protein [candidate division KSB3 bacterium]